MMRREVGAGHGVSSTNGSAWRDGARVGAAGHGRGRGQQPDAAVGVAATACTAPGCDHAEDVDAERRLHHPRAQRRQRRRGRRVAGDDEQLRAGAAAAPRRSAARTARARPGRGRRTGSARCRRGTGSPRAAAARAARAARSGRRRRSRRRRSGARAGRAGRVATAPWSGGSARSPLLRPHAVDRRLDLAGDRMRDPVALHAAGAPRRRSANSPATSRIRRDVLDGPLTVVCGEGGACPCSDGAACPRGERGACPRSDGAACPRGERGACPRSDGRACPPSDGRACPSSQHSAGSQRDRVPATQDPIAHLTPPRLV